MAKAKKKKTKKKTETDGEGEGGKPNKIVGLIGSVIGPVILGASTFGVVYLIPSNAVHGPEVVETEAHDEKPDYTVKARNLMKRVFSRNCALSFYGVRN